MASVCWEPRRAWGAGHLRMSGQCRRVSGLQDRWGLDGPQSVCVSPTLNMCLLCVHVRMWVLLCLPGHLRRLSDQRVGMQPPGLGRCWCSGPLSLSAPPPSPQLPLQGPGPEWRAPQRLGMGCSTASILPVFLPQSSGFGLADCHLLPGQPSGAPGTAYLLPCRKPRYVAACGAAGAALGGLLVSPTPGPRALLAGYSPGPGTDRG